MASCLLCSQIATSEITLADLLSFRRLPEPVICGNCEDQFERIDQQRTCVQCGREQEQAQICQDCVRWPEDGFKNRALYHYNDQLKRFMSQYKFNGDYRLRVIFQTAMRRAIVAWHPEIVVPIPITPVTLYQRGFNQVAGLLEGIPVVEALRTKQREKGTPQADKNRQQRLLTPQPFLLNIENDQLANKRILIVDDVYTTGRTIRHAATLLRESGASTVHGLTLAHG